jgi:hypothetical protein
MPLRACTVAFRGVSGVRHSVDLDAESVYEAAIRGIALLKKESWTDAIGSGMELEVTVREPSTTHTVTIAHLKQWLNAHGSPADLARKVKLRQLLKF